MASSFFTPDKLEKNKERIKRRTANRIKPYGRKNNFDSIVVSESLFNGEYQFTEFHKTERQKSIYQCATLSDEVVLKSLNEVLINTYKIRQSDRNLIVKQVIDLLNENHEKYIYRLDIKDFYENISFYQSAKKIINDGLISVEYEHAIWSLYSLIKKQLPRKNKIKGLPRGLSISSTFSELHMRDFDNYVKRIDGIYYYARYVDDIIFFSTKSIRINDLIKPYLPIGLSLNEKKLGIYRVDKSVCKQQCYCNKEEHNLNLLGYKFIFKKVICNKKTDIKISISDNKKSRFRKRLHDSFSYYRSKGKESWLVKRISFLTSNFLVDENKSEKYSLYSGIYYNYMRINEFSDLRELDELLYHLINYSDKHTRFKLDNTSKSKLLQLSFIRGFKCIKKVKFNAAEIKKIKGIWNE